MPFKCFANSGHRTVGRICAGTYNVHVLFVVSKRNQYWPSGIDRAFQIPIEKLFPQSPPLLNMTLTMNLTLPRTPRASVSWDGERPRGTDNDLKGPTRFLATSHVLALPDAACMISILRLIQPSRLPATRCTETKNAPPGCPVAHFLRITKP